jgi:predicted negative regulator of RcsB-dependent stress response
VADDTNQENGQDNGRNNKPGRGSNITKSPKRSAPPRHTGAEHVAEQVQIKDPDAVQKGIIDVWGWVEDHAKILAAALVLLIIAGIAHVVTHAYWDRQERKAQGEYFAAESKYAKIKEGFDRAKLKGLVPPSKTTPEKADVAASGDLSKDYGSVLPELEKVARERNGTTAGAQAALLVGETYLEYKQADKAAEFAELPVKGLSKKNVLNPLARVLWGNALATKNDCAGAVKIWQEVLDDKGAGFLHGEVGLRSGLCFESMNQPEKATEMYRKVTVDDAQSASATTAKGLLRALEVRGAKAPAPADQPKG